MSRKAQKEPETACKSGSHDAAGRDSCLLLRANLTDRAAAAAAVVVTDENALIHAATTDRPVRT